MPKIPTKKHPLAQVRAALGGWTQQKLADKAGVALVTIKKIESGKLKPGRDLLGRLMWITGADPESLLSEKATIMGLPYSAELGAAHVRAFKTKNDRGEVKVDECAMERVRELLEMFGNVLTAAAKRDALYVIGWSFTEWAAAAITDYKLQKSFADIPPTITGRWLQGALKSRKKSAR